MKKLILVLIPMLLVIGLFAVEFDISGENITRAAIANNSSENDGGWADNYLYLGMDSQFHQNLYFRVAAEIGYTVWGNGGGAINTGEIIHIRELYLDYYSEAIDANISFGQLYWNDKMCMLMDDYFSGVMLRKDIGDVLSTEFAWMKASEGDRFTKDDHNIFMAHAMMDSDMPMGAYLLYGQDDARDLKNITFMPYIGMETEAFNLDASVFADLQMNGDTDMGFGGAVKATMDLSGFELGADVLLATENGLTTISPWYKNGLYIYGIGEHHDDLSLYWDPPYKDNNDFFASMVGKVKVPVGEKIGVFGAAGYLIDMGFEANLGMEYEIIPDLFNLAAYGAYGRHDNETNNYAFGTTLKVEF